MMKFNRKYNLYVLPSGGGAKQALNVNDLRVDFTIKKDDSQSNNTLELSIYNLSEATKSFVQQTGNIILMEAGYENNTPEIFRGVIDTVGEDKSGGDVETKIKANDGEQFVGRMISKSFQGKVFPSEVVKYIAGSLQLKYEITGNIDTKPYNNGYVIYGDGLLQLKKVLNRVGYTFSIQNGKLDIVPAENERIIKKPVYLVNSETGLLEEPKSDNEKGKVGSKKREGNKYKIETLLAPEIISNTKINLVSKKIKSVMLVKEVKHIGNNQEGDWKTEMKAVVDA